MAFRALMTCCELRDVRRGRSPRTFAADVRDDVRDDAAVSAAVQGTVEALGRIDVPFNGAGNLLPVPWTEPEDVAAAVLYPASDAAPHLTGSSLVLDAGLLTR